jgi:hypothetical protein
MCFLTLQANSKYGTMRETTAAPSAVLHNDDSDVVGHVPFSSVRRRSSVLLRTVVGQN